MSSRIPRKNKESSKAPRSRMSVLTIAFAIAMAFFLVIGMVAVGITEFVGGNDQPTTQNDFSQSIEEQGENEEQQLRERIAEDPDDYSAHSQLAVLLGNTGRVDEAITHYEQALQGNPDDVALRMSFARTLENRGYDLDAEIQLERVLEDDGDNAEATYLLAEIKMRGQPPRTEEAEELFERVIEIDPDSFHAEMARERLATPEDDEGESDDPGADDTDQD
jgi:cytochrome c-type biogenesis protein CcmH/NrfG